MLSGGSQPIVCVVAQRPRRAWRASRLIRDRARQLRNDMTAPERTLWSVLRNGQLDGYRFRRQHPVGDFIVDFFCPAARLVIEVDGDSHEDQMRYDRRRSRWLAGQKDYRVLRVSNLDVMSNLEGVYDLVLETLRAAARVKRRD
jgi:very-short-patch-repair endonuclease